jgi:ligand-binding sensor domain-containing protein
MNRSGNIAVLLGFSFVVAFSAYPQVKFDKPVLIAKESGLPASSINSIRKGDDGFVWVGTREGLCRFDGLQVKIFRKGGDLRYSLFNDLVFNVLPVGDRVWMGTNQGISVLNTKDNSFKHYQLTRNGKLDSLKERFDQAVIYLYKDKTGGIWIGTRDSGLYLYDGPRDNFRSFPLSKEKYPPLVPSLGPATSILNISESKTNDSIIWAGTPGGLQEINKYTGHVSLFTFSKKSKDYQVAINAFRRLYHHDDGLLYVGTWAAGVNVFDPVARTYTPLQVKNEVGKKIVSSVIAKITRKSDHEIWISGSAGLAVYDSRLKDITWYKFNNANSYEFYAVDFVDDANRAWFSNINGLNYFDPAMQQFSIYSYKHLSGPDWSYAFYILSDSSGNNITVCPRMTDGIYHFDKLKQEWSKTPFPQNKNFKQEIEVIRGFEQLRSGDYILSSDRGIFLYSERKRQLTDLTGYLPVSSTRWGEFKLDRSGNLWISADVHGLIKWNLATHKYHIYKDELFRAGPDSLFGRLINLFQDSRGNIWFARLGGFGVYDVASDSIVNFLFTKNNRNSFPVAVSFAEDREGRIWISSDDGGLGYALSINPDKGIVYKVNIKDKGFSGSLSRLATDKKGEVWGYTSDYLVKINPNDLSFTTYSFRYGIDDAEFWHFSFLPSGEIIFGGRNNIAIANPSELKRNTEIPFPYIDEVQILNQPLAFVNLRSPLRLGHKQNFFSIGFSARAYTMAKDVKFRYRLNGFDDWTEVTGRRFANYTNVPGGDYVFQLQAANNEGAWNEKIVEMPVHIATPFWLTWWFITSLAIGIALAGYWLYRNRVEQIKKKQRLKSEYEKKLASVEMSALLAQMNPHFLFNSLNSIDSYIIRNESKKASEYLNNFARLMRLILQNSRSNYISLKDELEALELYMQMESLRFKNKFAYSIAVGENVDMNSVVIPPMLIQPYVENAIWHGLMHMSNGTEGRVKISLSKSEDDLRCVIEDNGIGRAEAAAIRAQKQTSHKRSMGMQITQDRIEIINKLYNMNASVSIHDITDDAGNPRGTKVELTIPV